MITQVNPKLPMRNKEATKQFYVVGMGFTELGKNNYNHYLMVERDNCQLHFFLFEELDLATNYGQVYLRTNNIEELYQEILEKKLKIHPNGPLEVKPWGQKEFSMLDPDNNLLTFGQNLV